MLIGYVRCVPNATDETTQIKTLADRGVDRFFNEQTGSRALELKSRQDMLNFAREGDSIIVDSIRVIARNIGELLDVMRQLEERKVTFISISDDIDTSTDQGTFLLMVFHAMSELDADSIVDQRREDDAKDYMARGAAEDKAAGTGTVPATVAPSAPKPPAKAEPPKAPAAGVVTHGDVSPAPAPVAGAPANAAPAKVEPPKAPAPVTAPQKAPSACDGFVD